MPLPYDCEDEDGSWGRLSSHWCALQFKTYKEVERIHPWLHRDGLRLPSGTYVICFAEVRFETQEMRDMFYDLCLGRGFSTRDLIKRG